MDINNYEPEAKKFKDDCPADQVANEVANDVALDETEEELLHFNLSLNAETNKNIYNLITSINMDTKIAICDGIITAKDDSKIDIEQIKNDTINRINSNLNKNPFFKAFMDEGEFKTFYNLNWHNSSKQKIASLKYSMCENCGNYRETEFNNIAIEHICPPRDETLNNEYFNNLRFVRYLRESGLYL